MNTRRIASSVVLVLLWGGSVPLAGFAQLKGSQSKALILNPAFSEAATQLTRTVDSYEGVSDAKAPALADAFGMASQRAHTAGEQQAMKALRTFLEDKMDNNALRAQTLAKAEDSWQKKHAGAGPSANEEAAVRLETMDLPGMREMTHREDDCAAELRQIFGMKYFREPARCSDVRLRVDEHAMHQFFSPTAGS